MKNICATDDLEELLPIVDVTGKVSGCASRGICHSGTGLLHPVVHLHLTDEEGRIYLQLRPQWKQIQPGRWDTAVGGHVGYNECIQEALNRETKEEIGLLSVQSHEIGHYIFESDIEKELVYVFLHCGKTLTPKLSNEVAGGRYWSPKEIAEVIGKGILTPNFEEEYIRIVLPALKKVRQQK